MYFGSSKEPSHCDGSFEYPKYMFWMRNKENNFPMCTLIWRSGSHFVRVLGDCFVMQFMQFVISSTEVIVVGYTVIDFLIK